MNIMSNRNYNMLKYFEKYIIPKVISFCNRAFSQYEIDDYCE